MKECIEYLIIFAMVVITFIVGFYLREMLCQYENMRFSIIAGQCVVKESK